MIRLLRWVTDVGDEKRTGWWVVSLGFLAWAAQNLLEIEWEMGAVMEL